MGSAGLPQARDAPRSRPATPAPPRDIRVALLKPSAIAKQTGDRSRFSPAKPGPREEIAAPPNLWIGTSIANSWTDAGAPRRHNAGARRHVDLRQPLRSRAPAQSDGMQLRAASQPGRTRRRAAAPMRADRERGQALPRGRRLSRDARRISKGRRAPRIPQIGWRVDRACRALPAFPPQDRDRGVRAGPRARE